VDCSRVELLTEQGFYSLLAIYTDTAHIETHSGEDSNLASTDVNLRLYRLAYRVCFYMVQPTGIEPVSRALQAPAMTTSARVALNWSPWLDSNQQPPDSRSGRLPD
jgi:hypothetical protein